MLLQNVVSLCLYPALDSTALTLPGWGGCFSAATLLCPGCSFTNAERSLIYYKEYQEVPVLLDLSQTYRKRITLWENNPQMERNEECVRSEPTVSLC